MPLPSLVRCLRAGYSVGTLAHDLAAGVTVGLVALPLAMAFAIASGVPPASGLYCAVVAGFTISALGGSRTQIGGPTGAFVVVVSAIVAAHGLDGLFMCTLLAGLILIALGLTGLGTAVRYIPRPVVVGFTNGIAVLIASTQVKDLLGLDVPAMPGEFIARMGVLATAASTAAAAPALLGLLTIGGVLGLRRISRRIPGSVVVLIGGTAATFLAQWPVDTIGSRFGAIPTGLPAIQVPAFRLDLVLPLLGPALTVAMLGAIESLLSATVADRMTGDRHDPNVELTAQGVANVLSPLFGGLPATGAIARTATNVRAGARTPVAGIAHALTVLVVVVVGAPLVQHVPLAMLAGLLLVVSMDMGEWHEIPAVLRLGLAESAIWAMTFALTVLADLTVAVQAGMILAALLYIRRVTATTTVERVTADYLEQGRAHSLQLHDVPPGVAVYRIHGPFLVGSTDKLDDLAREAASLPPVVILRLRNMTAIDSTGMQALEQLAHRLQRTGHTLLLCGARDQPAHMFRRSGFARRIGVSNVLPSFSAAVARAHEVVAG